MNTENTSPKRIGAAYPDATTDLARAANTEGTPQTRSASYRLAYADTEFLLRDELMPVRLQLELLKPELLLQERRINSTIVVFGSSRVPDPETAQAELAAAEAAARQAPDDPASRQSVERALRRVERSRFYEEARRFGRIVSEAGQRDGSLDFVIATGGGPGIMEAANRGATDAGKISIGFNIVLPSEQAPNPYITPELCFQFHYFALRKLHLLMRACALVVFPGGFGTFDELFETLTLMQTGKVDPIPIVLFDKDYWRRIIDFDAMVEEGVITAEDLSLFTFVDSAEEAFDLIRVDLGVGLSP